MQAFCVIGEPEKPKRVIYDNLHQHNFQTYVRNRLICVLVPICHPVLRINYLLSLTINTSI